MRGERVPVSDEEVAIILLLHLEEATHSPVVVAYVQMTGRSDTADDSFHIFSFSLVIQSCSAKVAFFALLEQEYRTIVS